MLLLDGVLALSLVNFFFFVKHKRLVNTSLLVINVDDLESTLKKKLKGLRKTLWHVSESIVDSSSVFRYDLLILAFLLTWFGAFTGFLLCTCSLIEASTRFCLL
jgi:hypothetical protein